jgi:hypothetical protein
MYPFVHTFSLPILYYYCFPFIFPLPGNWDALPGEPWIWKGVSEVPVYIVTDLTVLQIWTLLLNGRVRILALPTQRCSFRIHGTEKYKSITMQCLQAERILPWQRIQLTVKFPKQPNCSDGRSNCERRCFLFGMERLNLRRDIIRVS